MDARFEFVDARRARLVGVGVESCETDSPMGLDIYTGPLTRYYAGQWKTETAEWAEQNGAKYVRVAPEKLDAMTDPARIRLQVLGWMEWFSRQTTLTLRWAESVDAPYATEKFEWPSFEALKLVAAYYESPGLRRPAALPDDFTVDPAFVRCSDARFPSAFAQIYKSTTLWLPIEMEKTYEVTTPSHAKVTCASSMALLQDLKILNEELFRASEREILRWDTATGAELRDPIEVSARRGFAVLWRHAALSIERDVPIILDW